MIGSRSRISALPTMALVVVLLGTALVTLGPRWVVVDGQLVVEGWLAGHPTALGMISRLGGLQAAGNLVLFAPLAALVAAAVPRRWLGFAWLAAVPLPLLAEWAQRGIAGRVPDAADVVLNTGGLIAAYVGVAVIRLLFERPRRAEGLSPART